MDSAVKGFPAFRLILLHIGVLLMQRDVRNQVHLRVTGDLVGIPAGQLHRIAVQIVEHGSEGEAAAELLEQNHILPLVVVEGVGVVRDPVDLGIAVLLHDAAGFSCAGFAPDVGGGQLAEVIFVFGFQNGLASLFDVVEPVVGGGQLFQDLGVGLAVLDELHDPFGLGFGLAPVRGQLAPFLEGFRVVGFVLGIVQPLSLFADVIPVLTVLALGGFDVCAVELGADSVEHDAVAERHVKVGVVGSLFPGFVAHTPVFQSGEVREDGADSGMVEAVVIGVVDGEGELAGRGLAGH